MQPIYSLADSQQISIAAIRDLVQQRIQSVTSQGFVIEDVVNFAVVEVTDTVATIEQHLGVSISTYEMVEEFPSCFDLVYVLDQAGAGVELFVPKKEGIDSDLLAMCRMYAFSSPPEERP